MLGDERHALLIDLVLSNYGRHAILVTHRVRHYTIAEIMY
jgi:hypothetical protein